MVIQCVSHTSLQEDVEEGGEEQTTLSYSDCGSETVPYADIKVDCAGGLAILIRLALMLYCRMVANRAACHIPSNASLKSTKTW